MASSTPIPPTRRSSTPTFPVTAATTTANGGAHQQQPNREATLEEIAASRRTGYTAEDDDERWMLSCAGVQVPLGAAKWIKNEGSTARDFLARERNWLSWVKLSVTLFVISAALLLRFSFSEDEIPNWEASAEKPLGILFFCSAWSSLLVGIFTLYSHQNAMRRKEGFIYSGRISQAVTWAIGLLTVSACILLLVAEDRASGGL
ncbi:hypothetical protein T439DRAFT_376899 [Meredithblackwellia eburnea MCA 4105]